MTDKALNINAKSVLKYAFLPGIIPRARELGSTGFGYLAFLFACVYKMVRILPSTHAYVNPENIGKFSIVQVVAAAANNVQLNRRNIDQIIVFFALLVAVALLFLQFVLLLLSLITGRAFAQTGDGGGPFTSIFLTQNPQTDIAFLMLDYVFGIPAIGGAGGASFFGSNALQASASNPTGGPTPFQIGMHALFNFYNLAILLVAVLIFLYYIMVVVIETAKTGVPFGRRFSKLYAPFRLVFAIGLLVPLYSGFNAAQYITLTVAKMGSSFATNGWILYNRTLQNPMAVENTSLVAKPSAPSVDNLLYFSSVYHACREMYAIWHPKKFAEGKQGTCIKAYVIVNGKAMEFAPNKSSICEGSDSEGGGYSYTQAKKDFGQNDMEVVMGEYDPERYKTDAGGVHPYCGKITISLGNDNPAIYKSETAERDSEASAPQGIRTIEAMYYLTVQNILRSSSGISGDSTNLFPPFMYFGERAAHALIPVSDARHDVCHKSDKLGDGETCLTEKWYPDSAIFEKPLSDLRTNHQTAINNAYDKFRKNLDLKLNKELEKRGWGGAGIWYNNIADMNGALTSAVYATPSIKQYPEVMEAVKKQREAKDRSIGLCDTFTPNLSGGKPITFNEPNGLQIAQALNETYRYFACFNANRAPRSSADTGVKSNANLTPNVIIDAIGLIFGINGLYDMRANSAINETTGQPAIHPLAQLSTIGKSLIENAIRNMAMALGTAFTGGMLGALGPHIGPALSAFTNMFVGIATIGLTTGFVLFYVLPFLPFIHFFFAVGSWVKSIFEAMVGVPLWALAHLHIDGDGFSGRAAQGGYFMLLEIFLRPIVTLFGLIGGIAIFGAMAGVLNSIFDLVVLNVTGSLPGGSTSGVGATALNTFRRGVIDQFFFTIMYAILIYLMANASFKMIDTIPKGFMRWIGSGVQTFNDNVGDPAGNLSKYAAVGGSQISGQLLGGMTSGASATGGLIGSLASESKTGGK